MTLAARLEAHIKGGGVPIAGVSIGSEQARATWLVQPVSLQSAAQPLIDAFVEPTSQEVADEDALRETTRKELKAVALALWETIPAPTMTKPQLQARAVAIYKTL